MDKIIIKDNKNEKKNYREEYISYLMQQFISASSKTKKIDVSSEAFLKEFKSWLKERQEIMTEYKCLLDCMDLEYDYPSTVEVGKGSLDSLSAIKSNISLITPYASDLKSQSNNKIIQGNLEVVDIDYPQPSVNLDKRTQNIYSFMTHNPYKLHNIKGWDLLHNVDGYRIILGIFGNTFDKDIEEKENLIQAFRDSLEGYADIEFARNKDKYYSVLVTKNRLYKKYVRKRS